MQKHKALPTGFALLFLALLLGSLAVQFWATDRSGRYAGPTHLATDSKQVFVVASDTIYHLSSQGKFLAQYPATMTGMTDIPIDLRITGDNRLMIAGQRPASLRSCDTSNWDCRQIEFGRIDEPKRQFKVLVNSPPYRLLLTDSRGDNLKGEAGPDSEFVSLLPVGTLAGPNDLAFDSRGHLWIADTDHRRIVELVPTADGGLDMGRVHSAVNELTRDKRYYPIMLALGGDGNWWVTQAAEFSDRYADLVVYDPEHGVVQQVTLPGSVFATDVAAIGDEILVTDLDQFMVYRVNTGSYEVSTFGDDRFYGELSRLRQEKQRYALISRLAMVAAIVFGVLMVLAAVIATPRNRRWTPVPVVIDLSAAPRSVPQVKGIHWLNRNPKVDRSLKWLEIALTMAFILALVGGMVLYSWMRVQVSEVPDEDLLAKFNLLGYLLLLSGLLLVALVPLVRQSMKAMKRRLGTDGKQVCIRLNDGREIKIPPAKLAFTNQAIFYHKYFVPLQTGRRQNLYEDGEVETWIAPLLRQAEKLSQIEGLKHQLRQGSALLIWSLVSLIVLGLLLILVSKLHL
jgi:hypothetical protein